ncbi:hypothetical protein M3484_16745 [Pseudomonas sp. GX19020]|uniref:hypothetical protein n=1 Tax=Pseudomonas sp. GX19020 TaxID=2942277 RepID=UPI0020191F03|nr:hypothetical protein [Pseudomonas sp. GX19020]MCL4068221.1 hypothetical protein [Pseudomonas sp. GX19020]
MAATAKTVGAKSQSLRNVAYSYALPQAMEDDYVKEPAVGTRASFNPRSVDEATLARIKPEDGIASHGHVKSRWKPRMRMYQTVMRTWWLIMGLFRLKPCPPATQLRQLASEVMAHEYHQTASVAQVAS